MKFTTTIAAAAFMAAPSFVVADSCNRGGVYCRQSLLNLNWGNYHDLIIEKLNAANQPTDKAHIRTSIFNCVSGGDIILRNYCTRGCGGMGNRDPDFCL